MGFVPKETILELAGLAGEAADSVLTSLVDAACAMAENYTGRRFALDSRSEQFVLEPFQGKVLLHAYPVEELTEVKSDDGKILEGLVEPASGILRICPVPRERTLIVSYRGGYAEDALPAPVLHAVALLVSALHKSMDNSGQTLTAERVGNWQGTYAVRQGEGMETISVAAAALLRPYCARM